MGQRYGAQVAAAHPDLDLTAHGLDPDAFDPQSPNLFWPSDRAWCVATEIDLDSTYVGGSRALVEAILADGRLESRLAQLDDRVDAGGDDTSPLPRDQ